MLFIVAKYVNFLAKEMQMAHSMKVGSLPFSPDKSGNPFAKRIAWSDSEAKSLFVKRLQRMAGLDMKQAVNFLLLTIGIIEIICKFARFDFERFITEPYCLC
jgi:hypothetical protein